MDVFSVILPGSRLGDVPSLREVAIWADTGRGLPQASVLKEHPQLDPDWCLWRVLGGRWCLWRVLGGGWCKVLEFREVVDCPWDGVWVCGEWRELSVGDSRSGIIIPASSSASLTTHGWMPAKSESPEL